MLLCVAQTQVTSIGLSSMFQTSISHDMVIETPVQYAILHLMCGSSGITSKICA